MNIFEQASRIKLRFPSAKGELSVEQLWDLPLTSAKNVSLSSVASAVLAQLKAADENSFIAAPSPEKSTNTLRMAILEHVRDVRLTENSAALKKKEDAEEIKKIEMILASRAEDKLRDASDEVLEERLKVLRAG